jgi:predicted DNA-binding transcriptional regulator AlpA
MEETPMLFPIAPSEFWKQIRATFYEVVTEKLSLQLHPPNNSHLPEKALLKVTDVYEIFQVSKPTLYAWLKQKRLKSFKIMSRRYFLPAETEALISGKQKTLNSTGINHH